MSWLPFTLIFPYYSPHYSLPFHLTREPRVHTTESVCLRSVFLYRLNFPTSWPSRIRLFHVPSCYDRPGPLLPLGVSPRYLPRSMILTFGVPLLIEESFLSAQNLTNSVSKTFPMSPRRWGRKTEQKPVVVSFVRWHVVPVTSFLKTWYTLSLLPSTLCTKRTLKLQNVLEPLTHLSDPTTTFSHWT